MAKPPILTPPLPLKLPGKPWACIVMGHGSFGQIIKANCYYFVPTNLPILTPVHAGNFGGSFLQALAFPLFAINGHGVYYGDPNTWLWDGSVLHTYGGIGTVPGSILFADRNPLWCVLIQKHGIDNGKHVVGRWWSDKVSSEWADQTYHLTALGQANWNAFAGLLFGDVVSEGNRWKHQLFCAHTTRSLIDIDRLEVKPRLHILRKRIRPQRVDVPQRPHLPPFPTLLG